MFDKLNITPSELLEQLKKSLEGIHPDILAADADELIAAGWGDMPRRRIPLDWRTTEPPTQSGTRLRPSRRCCKCQHSTRCQICPKCLHGIRGCCERAEAKSAARDRYADGKLRPAKFECCGCHFRTRARACKCGHEKCDNCRNVRRDGTLAMPREEWKKRGRGHYPNQRFDVQVSGSLDG